MKKALLIGIDYVSNPTVSLKGCINDIINLRNMLIDAYDYEPCNIIILRDDSGDFMQPTRTNILEQMNNIFLDSENLEQIWFHYSGHGSQLQTQSCNDIIIPCNFQIIIPSNFQDDGVIEDTDLLEIIKKAKCPLVMFFDCCHSGSIIDMPWSFDNDVVTQNNNIELENQHIYVLSACRDNQTSADSSNVMDQNVGAFSNAVAETLRASHHNIEIVDLYKNSCNFLLENGYSQTPLLSSSNNVPSFKFIKLITNNCL